jgi:hypothetical protein
VSIIPFVQRFNLKKWERFNSEKVCSISYARIQVRVVHASVVDRHPKPGQAVGDVA